MTAPVWVDAKKVRKLTPMSDLVEVMRLAFLSVVRAPERSIYQRSPSSSLLLMPAWNAEMGLGVKIVDVDTERRPAVQGVYVLLDPGSGVPKAIFNGPMLTARRTAAASALASSYLSRPDAKRLLMIGTGALATHMIEAHCSVRNIERICVWGRSRRKAEQVVASVFHLGIEAETCADLNAEIARADIISSATSSTTPLIACQHLPKGCHLDLVGAFRPDMCEADSETFKNARVFVDTIDGALSEAGDVIQAIKAEALTQDDIEADLGTLCEGGHIGRGPEPDAITLFKSVGTAIEDLACADLIMSKLETLGNGTQ